MSTTNDNNNTININNMELMKIWSNLLSNCGTSLQCTIPTTYFMQGIKVFAYGNAETKSSADSGDENSSNAITISIPNQIDTFDDNVSEFSQEEAQSDDGEIKELNQDKTTPTKKKYARIQRIRYSREEYKCLACPYRCTTEEAFVHHIRCCQINEDSQVKHNNERRSCPICGKDREDEQALLRHMKIHRSEKHFCCDLCKFRSLQLKKLIQHRRMHTGEKPHLCPYCQYRSARRDNLRSHARRVHKKDLVCDTFIPRKLILKPNLFEESQNTE